MSKQETADDALLNEINGLFRSLADLVREQVKLKNDFDAETQKRKVTFDTKNTELVAKINQIKSELRKLITENSKNLIGGDLRSFVTEFARFSFRNVPGKFKVTNVQGAMAKAGKLGIKRKVCSMKVVYKLEPSKLEAHLDGHPEHFHHFEGVIERPDDWDSLSVKPNDTYHTRHDKSRLTPTSIPLNNDKDEQSSVA